MIEFSSKLDSNDEPLETTVNIRGSFGSGGFFSEEMLGRIARAAAGAYRLGRIEVSAYAVKTNLPPAGPFAGFGTAEGAFALKRHIAKIADTVGIEGMEWRRRHYSEKKPQTDEVDNLALDTMERSDYGRKWAAYDLLRRGKETSGMEVSPMRGIGAEIFAQLRGRPRYGIDGGGVIDFTPRKPDEGALRYSHAAASVIELEIDGVDFSAKIRGIWLSVLAGKLNGKNTVRRDLLKNIIRALGWTTSEKLEYEEGRINESVYFEYGIPKPSAIPKINIYFSEYDHDEADPEAIGELPYCVIPSAYLQALTQACGHHFETIPVSARDVWLILDRREREARGEKKE
jgi:CO/xanthine dehydrogenase Mo-binding subunit